MVVSTDIIDETVQHAFKETASADCTQHHSTHFNCSTGTYTLDVRVEPQNKIKMTQALSQRHTTKVPQKTDKESERKRKQFQSMNARRKYRIHTVWPVPGLHT